MAVTNQLEPARLTVDPKPLFEISPYLYMQFMEPLGTTDGSVEAGWDFLTDCWRDDLIVATRELAPPLMRWGGCHSSYYRWREGVGPRDSRQPALNLLWGGVDTNQIGTAEFVDFCRQVGAQPLICVNFESDGRERWAHPPKGKERWAGADEAAAWVSYCNSPTNEERRGHGVPEPLDVRLWQIGNETSYEPDGFSAEAAAYRTLSFAQAMRQADPTIELIGWGDSGWAPTMLDIAGEELDYVAYHPALTPTRIVPDSPLRGQEYRSDPARTWAHLMDSYRQVESQLLEMRTQVAPYGKALAVTECHFSLPGRNRCEVLSTWAAGVANARVLNMNERNGDILKIATLADFCGTRWQVNAVMIPSRWQRPYLMPVARVMSLYRRHSGKQAAAVVGTSPSLDVAGSVTDDTVYLHVVNTSRTEQVTVGLEVVGQSIISGRAFEIADDPMREIHEDDPDLFYPIEKSIPHTARWTFPAASVTAMEVMTRPMPA